jgi:hypothetical protein
MSRSRRVVFIPNGKAMVSVYYTIDGERYPRVTAICAVLANAGLAYWRGRVGNEEADRVHKFAGTVDLVAVLDDDPSPTVIDIKTSNSVSETWGLQLGAYQLALDEEGVECGRRVIVQLPSREPGVCHQHDLADHAQDQRAFINALKLYRWRESLKPTEPTGPRIRFGSKA